MLEKRGGENWPDNASQTPRALGQANGSALFMGGCKD
jgi:hypothetical protein